MNARSILSSAKVVALGALLALGVTGCGSSSGDSGQTGTLRVAITDAPSDAYKELWISIKEVRAVPNGSDDKEDSDPGLPVIKRFDAPLRIDVLKLRFLQEFLGEAVVPAGNYNQIRLILEANSGSVPVNYLVLNSDPTTKVPLNTPSAQQSGLKIVGHFEVKSGEITAVMIDFDPNTAVVKAGNSGKYNLKPTGIRIVRMESLPASFGSISGKIASAFRNWSSATLSVVPKDSSSAIAAGTVFSSYTGGSWEAPFTAFVPGGRYRVHVRSTGFTPYSSAFANVSSMTDTSLGTISLVPLP